MNGKIIPMDNNEMLLFIEILQKEYNEKGNLKECELNQVLNEVLQHEK